MRQNLRDSVRRPNTGAAVEKLSSGSESSDRLWTPLRRHERLSTQLDLTLKCRDQATNLSLDAPFTPWRDHRRGDGGEARKPRHAPERGGAHHGRGTSYGWVVVAAGALMTCVGIGSMFSLAVFLEPMPPTPAGRAPASRPR